MCVHDLEGTLLYVNTAAAEALGFRPEDGVGTNLRRFLAPSIASQFDAYLERIRAESRDSGLMRVVARDGQERIWLYRNVLHEEPGKPPRVLGHAQDVTDRVRAENALKESEQRFRLIADTAPVLIWMSGPAGRCEFLNRSWVEFTGRSLEEQRGDGWTESIHPADRDRVVAAYRAAVLARAAFREEYRLRRADGEYRWVLGTGVPRLDADGAFAGLVGSGVDVTEIRQAREVLEQARDELAALVTRHTEELERSNANLRAEIRQRERAEEEMARVRRIISGESTGNADRRAPSPDRQARGWPRTVLVVEPQADIRHLLRHVLQLQGYRVLVAGDPGEALSIVADRPEPVHLLLMDAPPPGTPALAGRLAAVHPGMRALYLSSAPPATAGRPGAPDPATILRKPFTMTSLLGKVRELLGG